MLLRLVSPLLAFVLGGATTFGLATLEPPRAAPSLRQMALARVEQAGADGAWEAPPQPGFPGGRLVTATWSDAAAPCEAERRDARTLELALAGGRSVTVTFEESTCWPEVALERVDGRPEALVVLRRARARGDDALTLLAWDLTTGAVEPLATIDAERASWSLDGATITLRGGGRSSISTATTMMIERRLGLELRTAFTANASPFGATGAR